MRLLSVIATTLHRTPSDSALSSGWRAFWAKCCLFGAASIVLLSLYVPSVLHQTSQWEHIQPNVELSPDTWNVLYQDDGSDAPVPDALWSTRDRRGDASHRDKMNARHGQATWLGIEVPTPTLKLALQDKANHLVIGWMGGAYRVFVDQELYAEGRWSAGDPIILTLPMQKLTQDRPMRIAIWVRDNAGQAVADYFDPLFGEGLSTRDRARSFASFAAFWWTARPFGLFVANVMIAALFFLLWVSAREKLEYFYMSFFALVGAFYQVRMMDIFMDVFSPNNRYLLETVLRFYEGAFGMFLGFSFARSRAGLFKWGIPVALLLPFSAVFLLPDPAAKKAFAPLLDRGFVPLLVSLGATACLIQAAHLQALKRRGSFLPTRIQRLIIFGVGLLLLASFYFMDAVWPFSTVGESLRFRVGQIIVALVLSAVAIQDYREQRRLIEKTPISPYHRRPVLPDSLHGAVLVMDLRNSEMLFRLGAENGEAAILVEECLSHMWTSVAAEKGVVLTTEGDGLRAFFDRASCKVPVLSAIRAAQDVGTKLALLREKLQGDAGPDAPEIRLGFRAGVSVGAIRPIWQEMGTMRQASWTEAGNTLPFVESARLMEIERKLGSSSDDCVIVMTEDSAQAADLRASAELAGRWRVRSQTVAGKHGVEYKVSAYDAGPQTAQIEELPKAA